METSCGVEIGIKDGILILVESELFPKKLIRRLADKKTAVKITTARKRNAKFFFIMSERRDSHPRPSPWQGDVLLLNYSRNVPQEGIGPPTQGSSDLRSTTELLWR